MKKVIFALAAVVALAACSKEQTVVMPEGNAIGFNTFVDKATRSAEDPSFTNDNLFANFGVFGTVEGAPLFNNVEVKKNGSAWEYANTQYWITGANYNFAAVAPQTLNDTAVYTNAAYAVTSTGEGAEKTYSGTTTLSFVNNGTTDLLYAEAKAIGKVGESSGAKNDVVGFTFRHVLSKVKFSFQNDYNATNSFIAVKNIQIKNAYASAKATLNANTVWEEQTGVLVLSFGDATDNESTTATKENTVSKYAYPYVYESQKELLLIPGAATPLQGDAEKAGYKVTFDVELYIGDALIKSYPHVAYADFTPVAGNCYDIKTAITTSNIDPDHQQEPIQFTVTAIGEWGTDDNGEANGNNNKVM